MRVFEDNALQAITNMEAHSVATGGVWEQKAGQVLDDARLVMQIFRRMEGRMKYLEDMVQELKS